jgi:hypothetical protein
MTDDQLIEEIRSILGELVTRVKRRVPGTLAVARRDDAMQPCASFAASASSESLDLCFHIHRQGGEAIVCAADLVRGGSGDILGEMSAVTRRGVTDAAGTKRLLDAARAFCDSQEDRVVGEVQPPKP